jgi:ribosomal protein S18 acetylase RimI-like enzyme
MLEGIAHLRPCTEADDAFVYDVFCTTWESEVAALPNQNLAQHVLRIQHIAQERRFASRYPGHQRYIVLADGEPAGRLYVHESASTIHVVDLTLMPRFRDRGLGSQIFRDLFAHATQTGATITMRVERRNERATMLYSRLGFELTTMDDLDNYFEWVPVRAATKEDLVAVTKEGPQGLTKEDPAGLTKEHSGA